MRNVSSIFKKALYDGNRNYQCTAYITLLDNTELTVTNTRIADNGISLDDNVSDTSSFTALGSAIINSLTLQINNVSEEYSAYDFTGASIVLYISLDGVQEQPIKICTMVVEKVNYNGMVISLQCLDAMSKFNVPYFNSSLIYPATLQTIITTACLDCDVALATSTFPNYDFEIATRPNDEALTYREIISYVATLAGCFARCNSNGALELKWFDKSALVAIENTINGGVFDEDSPYSTGDSVNGGVFNPWNVGDEADGGLFTDNINAHYITALSSQNLGTDDVVITGVQIAVKNMGEEAQTDITTETYGTDDYVIKIEDNPFITLDNMNTIGAFLQNQLAGLTFRYGTISHLNDPSIEAGDVAMVWDRKGNAYPLLITNTRFAIRGYQSTSCSADTPAKNSATRFSALTKSFVENKELVRHQKSAREALETRLTTAINSKSGMYETRKPVGTSGAYIYYLHDKPNLSESSAVIKITNEAVAVTPNYQQLPEPDWYGLTVDGNFIANIMSVIGIDFDWGTGGTLTLGGQNNINGVLTVLNANGDTIGVWNNDGIRLFDGSNNIVGQFAVGTNSETQIGKTDTSHIYMDYRSLRLVDLNGNIYFYISDLRDKNGFATVTDDYKGDGTTTNFFTSCPIYAVSGQIQYLVVTVEDAEQQFGVDYTVNGRYVVFTTPPVEDAIITFEYTATSDYIKGYSVGIRRANSKIGISSVAMGYNVIASGNFSCASGSTTEASGHSSFATGFATKSGGNYSHAEGYYTQVDKKAYGAHVEGGYTEATANYGHAEGWYSKTTARDAHAEGYYTTASGFASHAEGSITTASDNDSHAEGQKTTASGHSSHAEGYNTTASSNNAHAEGYYTTASNDNAHAEGWNTTASGNSSHAGGYGSTASKDSSFAHGLQLLSSSNYQTVFGKYNEEDSNNVYALIIGNGTNNTRSNTAAINWNGGLILKGNTVTSTDYSSTNPRLEFQNSDASKNAAFIFTDSDADGTFSISLVGSGTFSPSLIVPWLTVNGGGISLDNSSYLYGDFYNGTGCQLVGITGNDSIYFGRGSYTANKGEVYLVGNDVIIQAINDVQIGTSSHTQNLKVTGDIIDSNNNISQKINGLTSKTANFADKSVATSNTTSLGSFTLTAGKWQVLAVATFGGNATGYRAVGISTSDSSLNKDRYSITRTAPAGSMYTNLQVVNIISIESATTYYVNVYQTSGGALTCSGGYYAVKLL